MLFIQYTLLVARKNTLLWRVFFIPNNLRLQPESTFEGNAYTKAVRQDSFSNT
jgi:hypothetical protein